MQGAGAQRFIVLTDIGGSSRLWEQYPAQYPAALEAHNRIVEHAVGVHDGEVLKNLGDGYLAVFTEPDGALDAAVDVQLRISGADAPDVFSFDADNRLEVRAVVHGGTLQRVSEVNDWFGPPLNRAARIAGVGHPGQTLLSGFARQRLRELPSELDLLDLGRVRLRDLGEPEQLFQVGHPDFGASDFPALLGMDSRPNNLREQPGSFIGREEELRELRELLLEEQQRLITLIAPGGYGKSRAANQLCASLLHRYEHGCWTVELAPLPDALRIAERTADALGFNFFSADEPRGQLVNYLRNKQALIHFDNFEHVMEGADLVAAILADAPGVQCVVTSREALRLRGEKVVALAPLSAGRGATTGGQHGSAAPEGSAGVSARGSGSGAGVPARGTYSKDTGTRPDGMTDEGVRPTMNDRHGDLSHRREEAGKGAGPTGLPPAIELFVDRALLVNARFELDAEHLPAVHELCARLDGVPLAVELAAAWADMMSPAELLAELSQQLDLTARMTDVPERQRSVRASCDWSWNLLGTDQRAALMQCAVFRGGFHIEAAEAVIGRRGMALRAVLAGLLDKSWLYTRETEGRTRYSIRDAAAREYAWEKLYATRIEGSDETLYERAACSHAEYYSGLAEIEGARLEGDGTPTGQLEALRIWKLELENINEALDTALHRERVDWVLPVARSLRNYFGITSGYVVMRERFALLLEAAHRLESMELELHSQLGLGRAQWRLGDYQIARETLAGALGSARMLCDPVGEGEALRFLGGGEHFQGNYSAARELHAQALVICRETGNRSGEGNALNNLGLLEHHQGNYGAARELYAQALAIYREIGNVAGEAMILGNLGIVESSQGNYSAARELQMQALAINRETGHRIGETACLINLGSVEYGKGNYNAARELYVQALAISHEIGAKSHLAISSAVSAGALAGLGQYEAAAVALHGAFHSAAGRGQKFEPDDQHVIDTTLAALDAAVESGQLSAADLARWQAQGEAMSLDELADYTLAALKQARD